MRRRAPLGWLRSFECAARHASFTRAADELNITQAAVSKQIKALEAQLGSPLFSRHAHGLQLTEHGRRYWLDTRTLIQQLDQVTTQFVARRQHHRILVRCNISYSALVLAARLAAFRRIEPAISIEITHDVWAAGAPSDNTHLEIGYGPLDARQDDADAHRITDDVLFPVVAATVDDLQVAELPLIHVAGYYREWRWWLEQIPASRIPAALQPTIERHRQADGASDWFVDNSLIAYQLAAQGSGVALGRRTLASVMLASKMLRRLPSADELPAPECFFVAMTTLGRQHTATQRLYDWLIAHPNGHHGVT